MSCIIKARFKIYVAPPIASVTCAMGGDTYYCKPSLKLSCMYMYH